MSHQVLYFVAYKHDTDISNGISIDSTPTGSFRHNLFSCLAQQTSSTKLPSDFIPKNNAIPPSRQQPNHVN